SDLGDGNVGSPECACAAATKIKSDDVVVIGWIDPNGVTLNTANLDDHILRYYPPNGQIDSLLQKGLTVFHIPSLGNLGPIHPHWPRALHADEASYILNWLFKYAANTAPPNNFFDEQALTSFQSNPTNYKFFNRFAIEYTTVASSIVTGPITIVERMALIGTT